MSYSALLLEILFLNEYVLVSSFSIQVVLEIPGIEGGSYRASNAEKCEVKTGGNSVHQQARVVR